MRAPTASLVAALCWLCWLASACAGLGRGGEPAPRGRLPADVRPLHYAFELEIVPGRDRFRGRARIEIELDRPRSTLWLHGLGLEVASIAAEDAAGTPVAARWRPSDAPGVVAVRLARELGPGRARLRVAWSADFDRRLRGLYRVVHAGDAYAFTQFEPIEARRAFPCFDEPAFKTPFDVALTVRDDHVAVGNTPSVERTELGDGLARIRFATTPPLPTYLVAWAVGPLDVREAPDLEAHDGRAVPFRGVAPRGRGAGLEYALERTPPLLAGMERYFDDAYPYAKLDVIAVPDFSAGAMENVGAITFRESLLLVDEATAPERQRRDFTYVMAHELAHQWFGNLVTMPWWDDLWLNEAFATWLGYRVVDEVAPEQRAGLERVEAGQRAMRTDSLASARRIRQPIESQHDIPNAFDSITYSKGGAVLAMFERWLGADVFRAGIRRHVARHRGGNARASDLLAALSQASGRDVAAPFETFLEQPGVPLVETRTHCEAGRARLALRQSRYRPLGSAVAPDVTWQVPVCVRFGAGGRSRVACELLTGSEGELVFEGGVCPDWVMPNADAAGYYRFASAPADARRLLERGLPRLGPGERLALADSSEAAFRSGAASAADTFAALAPLAADESRPVATAPIELLSLAREQLVRPPLRPGVERYAARLYAPRLRALGWRARPGESGETRLLRGAVARVLAHVARDPSVRRAALALGRRYAGLGGAGGPDPSVVEPELAGVVLAVAVQDGGAGVFDALHAQLLESDDAFVRQRLLHALGAATDPELARRARALALRPELRVSEVLTTLWEQVSRPETRADAWDWFTRHFDALVARAGPARAGWTPWLAAGFCDRERADSVEAFLAPRIHRLEGGPRNLAGALEAIRLCAALVERQRAGAEAFFAEELSRAPDAAR